MGLDRYDTFLALPPPSAADAWSVEPPNSTPWRVGRSREGFPSLLISFDPETGCSLPRRLALLTYSPPAPVTVTDSAGKASLTRMAMLQCRSAEHDLARYFFRVTSSLAGEASASDERVFEAGLEAVVSIFRSLQQPAAKTIQGLWAELAVIAWAAEPAAALSAWHSSPRALHDFAAGDDRVEVKSTSRAVREHTFRLEQLIGGLPAKILVVSLILVEREDGVSVNDLVEAIRVRVGVGEPVRRLEAVVASSLGREWRGADEVRYDLERAREDVRFYWATQVPRPSTDLPPAVKDVRFTVDLSSVYATPVGDARAAGPLAAATLPLGCLTRREAQP